MMAILSVSANLINNLASAGFGHLQFVYDAQDGGLLDELEVQSTDNLFFGPWEYTGVRSHGGLTAADDETDLDHTTSISVNDEVTNPDRYVNFQPVLFDYQTPETVWQLLQDADMALQDAVSRVGIANGGGTINYDVDQNSNSFARTLSDIVGLDLGNVDQTFDAPEIGNVFGAFPGYGRNVLDRVELSGGYVGPLSIELTGTDGNDFISTGRGDDTIAGGVGDDILQSNEGHDELFDDEGYDLLFGGADADVVYGALDIGRDNDAGDYGGGLFEVGNLVDIYDGGKGTDTLDLNGAGDIRAGIIENELALAVGDIGSTDIAFGFEVLDDFISIDFTSLGQAIDYFADESLVFAGEQPLELRNFGFLKGSASGDRFELRDGGQVTIFGGEGADLFFNGNGVVLDGGNGSDTFAGNFAAVILGGAGNDTISSAGGGSSLSGGSGTDSIAAQIGDHISLSDANDTLTLDGVPISGDDVMFGATRPYALDNQGGASPTVEALLSQQFAIMVRPALLQSDFDGTQASIVWEGSIILEPDLATHFDANGVFIEESADATITFKLGDFGINSTGYMVNERNLEWFEIAGVGTGFITTPGLITGTLIDDREDTFGGSFEEFAGFERVELDRYFGFESEQANLFLTNIQFASNDGNLKVDQFDINASGVTIDGMPLDVNAPAPGVSVIQTGSDVQIAFGATDFAILTQTDLAAWQAATVDHVFGTATADNLLADNNNNLILSGSGDDVIRARGGDDTILYTSGNDVIENGNMGLDTLDLTQFAGDDVSFRIQGNDVFITTPDGEIELDNQVRFDVGDARSNIEAILFSDATLDEAGIKARALGDQSTLRDDEVRGTLYADVITGSFGNDVISARDGDDVITYVSGSDIIENGNTGSDTLDLSQYLASGVGFRVEGNDVVIATPNGEIELDNQVRFEIGDTRSNIETILFADGTLDEAGIKARAIADPATAGNDIVRGTLFADVITGSAGGDVIFARDGDDLITYVSGNDVIENGNTGTDTLDLSQYLAENVSFRVEGNDVIITTPEGEIEFDNQVRFEIGDARSNIETVLFLDNALDEAGIKTRALTDPVTSGDDEVRGTLYSDIIAGSAGNDVIFARGGDDIISYVSGDDVIENGNTGNDTLDLSQFASNSVSFRINGNDVFIATPDGEIELDNQVRFDVGDAASNIELILLSDSVLDEAGIKSRALIDSATTGDDVIRGSLYSDEIAGLAGNDVLTGRSGADTFVFSAGDGLDRVTDFSLDEDKIRFNGLQIADLGIVQDGNDVEITYSESDRLIIDNAFVADFIQSVFEFV